MRRLGTLLFHSLALSAVGCVVPGAEVDPSLDDLGGGATTSGAASQGGSSGKNATSGGKSATGGTSIEPDGGDAGTAGKVSGGSGGSAALGGMSQGGMSQGGAPAGGNGMAGAGGSSMAGGGAATAGTGGTGGSGGTSPACSKWCSGANSVVSVCNAYVPVTIETQAKCLAFCATAPESSLTCWNTHLVNAITTGSPDPHCKHAAGAPLNGVCPEVPIQ